MKINIRKYNIYELFVILYLLLEARFFYLFPIGSLSNYFSYKNKTLITIVVLIFVVLVFLKHPKIQKGRLHLWCLLFVLYSVFQAFRVGICHNLGINQIYLAVHGLLLLLLFLALSQYHDKERLDNLIRRSITIISIILCIVFILQAIAYNFAGISFIELCEYTSLNSAEIRNWGIRLTFPGTLIIFSMLLSWGQVQSKTKEKKYYILIILGLIYTIYVCQTRMISIATIATMALTYFFHKFGRKYNIIKSLIIIVMVLSVVLVPVYIENLFDASTGSVYARTYAYSYYFQLFKQNPIFGIGLYPDDKTISEITQLLHGSFGYANLTDVGFVGFLAQFGIVGIIFVIFLIVFIYKKMKQCNNYSGNYYGCLAYAIYCLGTISTLCIFDTQRIVTIPLYFLLIENLSLKEIIENINSTSQNENS